MRSLLTVGLVGFGNGVHMCVGQTLGHLEGEVLPTTVACQAATIAVAGPPKRRYNNTLRSPASLSITQPLTP